jgi:hypothetical protein
VLEVERATFFAQVVSEPETEAEEAFEDAERRRADAEAAAELATRDAAMFRARANFLHRTTVAAAEGLQAAEQALQATRDRVAAERDSAHRRRAAAVARQVEDSAAARA